MTNLHQGFYHSSVNTLRNYGGMCSKSDAGPQMDFANVRLFRDAQDLFCGTVGKIKITDDTADLIIMFPTGLVATIGADETNWVLPDGCIKINYDNTTRVYKNPPLEFNRYINTSDLLEDFIDYLGNMGITQDQFREIPIMLFIRWLVVRAAEQDGDDPGHELKKINFRPRCMCCGKFIPRKNAKANVNFCNKDHMTQYMDKQGIG